MVIVVVCNISFFIIIIIYFFGLTTALVRDSPFPNDHSNPEEQEQEQEENHQNHQPNTIQPRQFYSNPLEEKEEEYHLIFFFK